MDFKCRQLNCANCVRVRGDIWWATATIFELSLELFAVIHILGKASKMRKLQLRYYAIVLALRKC